MIKVRFAPSPTGFLHIGGARTALFNWMYAKSQKGIFLLRIEDTDQKRSTKEFETEILQSMKWLGMDWDELFYQSDRFDLYREYADKLVDQGLAYKDGDAILLKMPKKQIKIYDIIRGEIDFDTANFFLRDEDGNVINDDNGEPKLKDEVLIKADGSPAYSFCCVIDDALMEVSHVIRGEDHISNTPKQIVICEALGFKPPKYAHLPLILGEDGTRLSKRTGAVAVSDYKAQGFLPEALMNYLTLLGWAPGNNQEVFDMQTAVKKFSLKKVNKAAAVFSMDKLRWLNGQYLKKIDNAKLTDLLIPLLKEKQFIDDAYDPKALYPIVNLYKGRMSTLSDFLDWADYAFLNEPKFEDEAKEKHLSLDRTKEFECLIAKYKALENFNSDETDKAFQEATSELGIKASELVHPVRVALTGKAIGPSLFDIIAFLGKDKVVERLSNAFN